MKKRIGIILIVLGTAMIAAAVSLSVNNITESNRAASEARALLKGYEVLMKTRTPDEIFREDVSAGEMKVDNVDGHDIVGVLDISKLGISLPVIAQWSYDNLRVSACRYSGTAADGNFIILAHNYTRHFAPLRRLGTGDDVEFTDNLGQTTAYRVDKVEILGGYELKRLVSSDYDLTLFTCTYGGASRVVVRCVKA